MNVRSSSLFLLLAVGLAGCSTTSGDVRVNPADGTNVRVDDPQAAAVGDRYIVGFRDVARGRAAVQAAGGRIALELPRQAAVAAYLPAAAVAGLGNDPAIDRVEIDPIRVPYGTGGTGETVPYGIDMVQADQLAGSFSDGATVCIIDSGYGMGHEDLQVNTSTQSPVMGSTDDGTGDPFVDKCGHGTHVAGTISAIGGNGVGVVGVNPSGVNLYIVKVFGPACAWAYSSSLIAAVEACRSGTSGNLVISMSLGGGSKSHFEQAAFDDAYANGVLSVAAAGNAGNRTMSYPASYGSVISVGAIDQNEVVADFSQHNSQVELAAPGVGVLSTVPFNDTSSLTVGTSTYQGHPIEFAARTSPNGVSGTVVDGGLCDASGAWKGAAVLCERGSISFFDKVTNVQEGGGVAAIIYNNAAGNFYGTLGDGNTSLIPAISLSQEDGQALVAGSLGSLGTVVNSHEYVDDGYQAWDGTSMATPHVSGVVALVWSQDPAATNTEIREALDAKALDLGPAGRDPYYGYGLVQAKDAADYLAGGGPTCTQAGGSCSADAECCSDSCKGRPGHQTCR